MDAKSYLSQCLGKVLEMKGQDLFLKVGTVPRTRVGSKVVAMSFEVVKEEDTAAIVKALLNPAQEEFFKKTFSVDFAFSLIGANQRFRANAFFQQGVYSLVIRTLWKQVPSFEALKLPIILKKVALERSGIILIGGTVSSGKTTTLNAMIQMMNQSVERHIITIEDPVEYIHKDNKCIINQREIGQDAPDFKSALKVVVRQSPDVVMVGEMRDAESFNIALTSAEVGRLVLSTVHAKSTVQIIDRVLGFYPPEQREPVLSHLYPNVTCFAVQKLLVGKDGTTLVPAVEIMVGNYTIKQLLREKKFDKVLQALRNGAQEGMQTMDQSILKLWQDEMITTEVALAASERPQELENSMKGIRIDGQTGKILGG